jgi:hypothetical protein
MRTLELAYARGSMFGRDLFHYGLSAVVFFFCVLSTCYQGAFSQFDLVSQIFLKLGAWEKTGLTVLLVLVSYALGHLLLAIGFLYRAVWKWIFNGLKHVENLVCAEGKVKELVLEGIAANPSVSSYPHDYHLFCEMSAYHKLPNVHAAFIERYNTLAFLRLSLASSTLTGGIFCISLTVTAPEFVELKIALFWVAMGVVLLRQHFITRTGFLNRVAAAFVIGGVAEK